ncbi:hypothetical protein [Oerskovia paurometabola]|uniref:DUF4145 domain-containing protein n=1 Tax=Oerskovia paurometabola TaxID=162170 RepID=A0ABW1X8V4_9CELL|nr:hypothetical protein [Oerskovia paurometabola]MBM7497825.1 hypothetical protein [Oerskovia paurometabola]
MPNRNANDVRQLAAVRAMLEDATKAARNANAMRAATAVVLLDGVVERITYLAAVSRGVTVPRNGALEPLIEGVREKLEGVWDLRVGAEMRQMHRARNIAQHEGVAPGIENLGVWCDATLSYVRSLTDAVFGTSIDTVALTDAVADTTLRTLLEQAANHLMAGEDAKCAKTAGAAVAKADAKWRALHALGASTNLSWKVSEFRDKDLAQRLDDLERLQSLGTFSQDTAESAWFIEVTRLRETLLQPGDGERALGFATGWVISFEEAAATWVPDRFERAQIQARKVRTGDCAAHIGEVLRATKQQLVVELVDVPDVDGYEKWRRKVGELAQSDLGSYWDIGGDGEATLYLDDSIEMAPQIALLTRALADADDAVAQERSDAEDEALAWEQRRQGFQVAVQQQTNRLAWLGDVSIERRYTKEYIAVKIRLDLSPDDDRAALFGAAEEALAQELRSACESAAPLWGEEGRVDVRPVLEAGTLSDHLRAADKAVTAAIENARSAHQQRQQDAESLRSAAVRAIVEARKALTRPA